MILPINTMIQIVEAGGGLVLDLNKMIIPANSLIQIASVAKRSGATITIKNPNFLSPTTIIQISLAGGGKVTFEI